MFRKITNLLQYWQEKAVKTTLIILMQEQFFFYFCNKTVCTCKGYFLQRWYLFILQGETCPFRHVEEAKSSTVTCDKWRMNMCNTIPCPLRHMELQVWYMYIISQSSVSLSIPVRRKNYWNSFTKKNDPVSTMTLLKLRSLLNRKLLPTMYILYLYLLKYLE